VIVFVALDDDQQPVEVPKWVPESEEDQALEQYAVKLREASQQLEDELDGGS
jgi:acyl-CoA hydrolase